jgi:cell division septation protein DedD
MNRPRNLVVARARAAPAAPAAPAEPRPAAPPVREASAARPGTRMVQLGAYDSEEMTRRAWSRLVAANPDLLSSKSLYVERATGNARVFYRLRVAGFESSDQTRVMCESLRARGIDCIPVTLQ